jgi:hypothetical protein
MLKKILFKHSTTIQFIFATLGALIGLTALLLSLQLIQDVRNFQNTDADLFGPNMVVIQKKVTRLTTFGMNSTTFSAEEIQELSEKSFIKDVAPFQSADFKVGISEVKGDGLPHFYADMFFQSIPDQFMDVEVDWNWNEQSEFIPIVLPRDFVMLINYGYAQSQGINQISEELLMSARLTIHLEGKNNRDKMIGRVVGFSHKISSILVPEDFLTFANKKFGSGQVIEPSRVFIATEDDSYGELEQLMEDMHLDINKSAIDVAKIKTIIAVVITIFGVSSLIIMLLSLLGFIQYSQLILNKSTYEIQTLIRLGYRVNEVLRSFIRRLSITFGIISISAVGIMLAIKLIWINSFLSENGMATAGTSSWLLLLTATLTFVLFIGANYLNIRKMILRLGRSK